MNLKAVILAGGLGTRLKPFTEIIPKPLLPIGEKSILEIQIEHLKNYGFHDIYIATNYKSEYIEKFLGDGSRYGVNITISKEKKQLGTVGPLSLLKEELKTPFLVINGDILTNFDYSKLYEFSKKNNSILTITVKEILMPFAFGNIYFEGDYVTGIEEKPDIKSNILAGIYLFKTEIFDIIPYNQFYNMDTLINKMLEEKIPISKFEIKDYWLDIGQIDDFKKAQEIYKKHLNSTNNAK